MNRTNIGWCDFSANPLKYRRKSDGAIVWACVKVSAGCRSCYAELLALRFDRGKLFNAANMEELEPFLDEKELHKMLTAKTVGGVQVSGSRVFVGDMTDLFGEWVPDELLDRLFAVFALRPDVAWQVLTKRAERMQAYMANGSHLRMTKCMVNFREYTEPVGPWPLPNVWLGVSAENQQTADERIPLLLQTPAAVRFVSYEPALGPVDFRFRKRFWEFDPDVSRELGAEVETPIVDSRKFWLIVGGESGPGARPCDIEWIRSAVRQCRAAGVACFVKQLGGHPFIDHSPEPAASIARKHGVGPLVAEFLELRDKKGGDQDEWPADLRGVREFPQ